MKLYLLVIPILIFNLSITYSQIGDGLVTFSSNPFDFQSVQVNSYKDSTIFIKNIGTQRIDIVDITPFGGDAYNFGVAHPIPVASIKIGDSVAIKIRFLPKSVGAKTSNLKLIAFMKNSNIDTSIVIKGNGINTDVPENNLENSISLFPNPVSNILNLKNLVPGSKIQIINSMGQTVLEKQIDNDNMLVDMLEYTPGIYLIKYKSKIYKFLKL